MPRLFRWWRQALFALLAVTLLPVLAQPDPPGRVGRIAESQGQVLTYDLESGDWIAAVRNRPLTTGDRVATDGDGRVELRIGSSTIRLGAGSEIDLQQIDDEHVRVQLHSGQLALRLRSHEAARKFELVTAEGRFQPDRAGRYRRLWEGFIPHVDKGTKYKFKIVSHNNTATEKADPFAFYCETPPNTASVVWDLQHSWNDTTWIEKR